MVSSFKYSKKTLSAQSDSLICQPLFPWLLSGLQEGASHLGSVAVIVLWLPGGRIRPQHAHFILNWFLLAAVAAIGRPAHIRNFRMFYGMNLWLEHEMQIRNRTDSGRTGSRYTVGAMTFSGWSWCKFISKRTGGLVYTPSLTIIMSYSLLSFMMQHVQCTHTTNIPLFKVRKLISKISRENWKFLLLPIIFTNHYFNRFNLESTNVVSVSLMWNILYCLVRSSNTRSKFWKYFNNEKD